VTPSRTAWAGSGGAEPDTGCRCRGALRGDSRTRSVALNHRSRCGLSRPQRVQGSRQRRREPSQAARSETPFRTRSSSRPDKARTSTPPGLGGRVDPVDEGLVELGIAGAVGVLPDHRQKRSAASQLTWSWTPTVWSSIIANKAFPALAPRFSQSATLRDEELAGQPSRASCLRQTVSSGNEVMGPPGRGRPASEIRLATLPSVFGKEEPTELFAYNDLAEAGRTTPLAGVSQKPHSPTSSGASPFSS